MSREKKNDCKNTSTEKIILATVIIQLISATITLVGKLIE